MRRHGLELLRELVRNYSEGIKQSHLARLCIYPRDFFKDEMTVDFVRELVVHEGNVSAAIDDLRQWPATRVSKLRAWVGQPRQVLGLLEWKGGQ